MRPLTCLVALALPLAASSGEPKAAPEHPRRALVVQVHNYLYLNPLTAATPARNREALDRFANSLRVPNGKANRQFFILSDNLPSPEERTPTRSTILTAVREFCQSSRAQDRIVLYFHGHAFESREQGYFAPVEGEAGDVKTLVPIAEIYAALKTCKATQKVVVWDVCPCNPEQAAIRPSAGPMTLELLLALANTTAGGIEVVVPCLPSQFSREYRTPKGEAGSVLLDAIRSGLDDANVGANGDPAQAIPFAEALPRIEKYLDSATKTFSVRQTPKLLGKRAASLAAIDAAEPPPAAVTFPRPAAAADAKAILQELVLPPLVLGAGDDPLPTLSFDLAALAPYRSDVSTDDILRNGDKHPLRVATLRSLQTIRDSMHPIGVKDARPVIQLSSPIRDAQKKAMAEAQAPLAVSIARLELEVGALESVEPLRARENKHWQANYDYTLAQLRLRMALLSEYNYALAHVRTDLLPDLPMGFTAWRLTPTDKMLSKKNERDLADAARSTFESLAAAHKGTPWETLAKRALATPPGLRWEPVQR